MLVQPKVQLLMLKTASPSTAVGEETIRASNTVSPAVGDGIAFVQQLPLVPKPDSSVPQSHFDFPHLTLPIPPKPRRPASAPDAPASPHE